jgi:hypothetical protein
MNVAGGVVLQTQTVAGRNIIYTTATEFIIQIFKRR